MFGLVEALRCIDLLGRSTRLHQFPIFVFLNQYLPLARLGRDAVASELRGMDAAYERCVKKAVIYSE
jgi:hypothetical protein